MKETLRIVFGVIAIGVLPFVPMVGGAFLCTYLDSIDSPWLWFAFAGAVQATLAVFGGGLWALLRHVDLV